MPTYEYRCTGCGRQLEIVHAVGATVEKCEHCGAPVRRVFSPPALIFKGPGFYITDHRKTPAASDGDGKAPAAAKTGAEAKPSEPAKAATPGEEKKPS